MNQSTRIAACAALSAILTACTTSSGVDLVSVARAAAAVQPDGEVTQSEMIAIVEAAGMDVDMYCKTLSPEWRSVFRSHLRGRGLDVPEREMVCL